MVRSRPLRGVGNVGRFLAAPGQTITPSSFRQDRSLVNLGLELPDHRPCDECFSCFVLAGPSAKGYRTAASIGAPIHGH